MRRVPKGLLSALLLAFAIGLFYFQPPTITKAWTALDSGQTDGTTVTTTEERSGLPKLMDILGAGLLAFIVWIWRKELRISGFGPFTGEPSVEQQKPKPTIGQQQTARESSHATVSGIPEMKRTMQRQYVLDLLEQDHMIGPVSLSRKLGVSLQTSEALLYELLEEGRLRADGFPSSTVFTRADSIENRVLDHIAAEISKVDTIRQERRYVRIAHRFEVDSYIRCNNANYIIEIKRAQEEPTPERLATWTTNLINVSNAIPSKNTRAILAIILLEATKQEITLLRKRIQFLTLDSGSTEIQIKILSAHDLERDKETSRRR